ncbi:MAG: glycosyltransferase family 4 protein [Cyanobacteria bacterium J06634_6]
MKVLFLASFFPKPDNSVMGTWALAQAQALVRQGIELEVVSYTSWVPSAIAFTAGAKAYANCPKSYIWPGDVIAHYPRWLYYPIPPVKQWAYTRPNPYLRVALRSAQRTLIQRIERYQPDLIFCHHSLPNAWMVTQLPARHQRPLVVLDHDFDEISDGWRYSKRKSAMQLVAERANAWLAVSQRMADDLKSLFPHANVRTHHNGIDLPANHLAQQPRSVELQGKTVVLACALFAERKGIPLLIQAFHQLLTKHPYAVLRIVGSGPEEEKVRHTIEQLGGNRNVQLLGRQSHAQVLQEMAWADCFALVGWDEPFATVYLEAMAAGKPIICCSDGGITDVVENGVHGLVVPPKDQDATAQALDQLLSDRVARTEMGKNARKLVGQQLTWDAKSKELIDLFQQILVHLDKP